MVRFQSCWCGSTGRWCPPLLKQTKPTICDEENKTHPAHFVAIDRTRPLDCLQLFTSREQSSSFFRILWDSVFAFLSFPFMVIQATLANLSFYIFFSHLHCDHADWKFPFPGFTWYSIFTCYSPSLDLPWELFFLISVLLSVKSQWIPFTEFLRVLILSATASSVFQRTAPPIHIQ